MAKKHSEYLENLRSKIIDSGFLSSELIDFYKSIFEYQENYIEKYKAEIFSKSSQKFIDTENSPVLRIENLFISDEDKSLLLHGLKSLTEILLSKHKGLQFEKLLKRYENKDTIFENSIKYLLKNDLEELKKISNELKIGIEEFIFVLVNWLKPYFIAIRDTYMESIELLDCESHNCPFCGYYPDISKIVESKENIRILHCGFCEYEWRCKRLVCTICENSDIDKLGFYTSGDDEVYRIDYCDNCKGYLKTIRIQKKFDETRYDLMVENILTNYLDSSAIETGYSRP